MDVQRGHRAVVDHDAEDGERIMVAAPRPSTRGRSVQDDVRRGEWAGDAGLALIVVIGAVAVAGGLVGHAVGAAAAGALIAGFVGLVAGFAAVYQRYRDL
jgi:hypothetical protein